MTKPFSGIYYIKKDGFFDTQVIVTRELDRDTNIWLTSLTRHLSLSDTQKLTAEIHKLTGKLAEELGSSVLDVTIRANETQFHQEINKEDDKNMIDCPALNELFEPKLRKACAEERAKGRTDNVKDLIRKKLSKHKSVETIAAELEEDDIAKIRSLIDEISQENALQSNNTR